MAHTAGRLRIAFVAIFAALQLVGAAGAAHAYTARVTRQDIKEGGGRCAGNTCDINGQTWYCHGGGYCDRA